MPAETDHRSELRRLFLDRLLRVRPESVLDVGCGNGELLEACRRLGTPAAGVERDDDLVLRLTRRGLAAQTASADSLPFADDSYDWVVLRHVLHHLDDPATALREAARVAQSGILVAEPWFDTMIPCQRIALQVDQWLKRQHRRLGRIHRDNLAAADVLLHLPAAREARVDCEYCLRWRPRPVDDFATEASEVLRELPPEAEQHGEYRQLLREIDTHGLSWNGSMILRVDWSPTAGG